MATQLKNLSDFSHTTVPDGSAYQICYRCCRMECRSNRRPYNGALATLQHGVSEENILSVAVPGSFELTGAAEIILNKHPHLDAVICLGCVIQGETKHFDFICDAVAKA